MEHARVTYEKFCSYVPSKALERMRGIGDEFNSTSLAYAITLGVRRAVTVNKCTISKLPLYISHKLCDLSSLLAPLSLPHRSRHSRLTYIERFSPSEVPKSEMPTQQKEKNIAGTYVNVKDKDYVDFLIKIGNNIFYIQGIRTYQIITCDMLVHFNSQVFPLAKPRKCLTLIGNTKLSRERMMAAGRAWSPARKSRRSTCSQASRTASSKKWRQPCSDPESIK
jgi:hypothetical protein